jgi:formyltetrahydrofolate-dependent phosphoribosylglycinamide formyltransferase
VFENIPWWAVDTVDKSTSKANLAVFVSGRGSNLDSIINSCAQGALEPLARVALVVSSKSGSGACEIAKSAGIDRFIYSKDIPHEDLLNALSGHEITFIALAGYLRRIESEVLQSYAGRILNVHPALLPKFGGKGMYGMRVHQAVIEAGEKTSGVTVHYVSEDYDAGVILAQEQIEVAASDTSESLAEKVLKLEHRLYPEAIAMALNA